MRRKSTHQEEEPRHDDAADAAQALPDDPGAADPTHTVQEALAERVIELEAKVDELEKQAADARDGMLRAIADLQNFRRRAIQEAQQARESAAAALAERLLPVLDNFERSIESAESGGSAEAILDGVKLTDRMLRAALEGYQVKPIPALGQPFDPHLHEVVVMSHSDHEEGTVIEEIERGYTIGRRVLRPTKARVSKGPEGE